MNRTEFLARIERIVRSHGHSLDTLLGRRTAREVLEQVVPDRSVTFSDEKARAIATNLVRQLDWSGRARRLSPGHA